MEIFEVSGEELSRAGVSWIEKENARISVTSIDEALPSMASDEGDFEEVDKELTYKDGEKTTLNIDETLDLGNGYSLKLDRFDQGWGSPWFSLYDENGDFIDDMIAMGKNVGGSAEAVPRDPRTYFVERYRHARGHREEGGQGRGTDRSRPDCGPGRKKPAFDRLSD